MAAEQKESESRYAKLIDALLEESTINVAQGPLWNDNQMWDEAYNSLVQSPLHASVKHDLSSITEVILQQAYVDVNCKDSEERRPLHHAQSEKVAAMLIKRGALINAMDKRGNTPLHRVPAGVIPLLIAHKADIASPNFTRLDILF